MRKRHRLRRTEITPELVRADVAYDPVTGDMTWIARRVGVPHGEVCGALTKHGYLVLRLRGVEFPVHRLAWMHHYGAAPSGLIRHLNGNKADNRIANLAIATASTCRALAAPQRNNRHGVKGAFWNKKDQRWIVRVQRDGKRVTVGSFKSLPEAEAAYTQAHANFFSS
jgi:hypothetical protein